ncbi:ImmA/IrrE family metallo-endopeptidase [Lysinibacillus sp. UGB7]|uniref:ImmA/IrrE family metallo-endopeptidase n=1 Tax=Lysinibacillus sp. UGB7 TaxID=3411039 RepID=UPI003B77A860
MTFVYTHLEDYIRELYTRIGVTKPNHLDPRIIASKLGFTLIYVPYDSVSYDNIICLNSTLSIEEQWQEFCHELCHGTVHSGNQVKSSSLFREYQEWKANSFALHACIPTFMLNKMVLPSSKEKAIFLIQKTFNVEYSFAEKRLDQYLNNHFLLSNQYIRIYG